jgi:hypothetical protein
VPLYFTGRACDVSPYNDNYETEKNVPIATGATAYTNKDTGEIYILIVNEGLWFGPKLDHSLINPNQLRHHGVDVWDNPYDSTRPLSIQTEDGISIPLAFQGTVLFADTRTPTQTELDTCLQIHLTSVNDWNPQTVKLSSVSRSTEEEERNRFISAITATSYEPEVEPLISGDVFSDPRELATRIISKVQVNLNVREDVASPRTFYSKDRHTTISAEDISERWCIGLAQANKTIKVTTQRGVRSALLPLSRRYRTDRMYHKKRLRDEWATDTYFGRHKSLDGNTCAQVFANKKLFVEAYPMESKRFAGQALKEFIKEWGVPDKITMDGSQEQTAKGSEFMKTIKKNDIDYHISEPDRQQQNPAEGVIREARKKWFRIMVKKQVPKRLWDYGLKWVCQVMQRTSNTVFSLDGRTPIEEVTGETPDISEYLDFGFYEFVWFKENAGLGENQLGRWLGVSHRIGNAMSYWVIKKNGQVLSRSTVQRVTNLELQTAEVKTLCTEFDVVLSERLKDDNFIIEEGGKTQPFDWRQFPLETDPDYAAEFQAANSDESIPEADDEFTADVYDDTYLNMEITLPRGAATDGQYAKVTKRMRDENGMPIGTANDNPILDSRVYEVEFLDGHKEAMAANTIAENMFAQVDEEGNRHVILEEIIDHRTDGHAVTMDDAFITNSRGVKRRRDTTKGWQLLIQWKDGSTNWVPLKDIKNSHPVQVAEYAVGNKIAAEPAFAWWVPYTLKKRNRILSKIKSRYWLRTHKFGIAIPKSVEEALKLDRENGNTLWWDSILKEMKNVRPAFEVWEGTEAEIPVGYQKINCHMIFDVKMGENFRRKSRFVANGHPTEVPASMTYSSVVSRDSVRIGLLIAALNDLEIMTCDIQNAFLNADCREQCFIRAGKEFGSEAGTLMIIRKALYGLKSSGAAFRALLAETLYDLSYVPTKADPDVWIRPAVKPDGFEYYEMVLIFVDDCLAVSHDPMKTMKGIQKDFKLKDDKIAPPDMYLGSQLEKKVIDGESCWTMTSEKYVKAAVANVEEKLAKTNERLPPSLTPMKSAYRPEIDASAELKEPGARYYQELIGVLRWAVELGRIDILTEVSMLSSHLALPRSGHLEQVYHIFGYLKQTPKKTLAFDPREPDVSEDRFQPCEWRDFYRGAEEKIPDELPKPKGNPVSIHCFVDADHAGDKLNRRSQTGILIFINRAPIIWYSKRQNTVETSTFSSEFIAMKTAVEQIEAMRYKLRMFGVPLQGPANVYCDNEAVCRNTRAPESTLKKKHNAVAYHRCREAVASGTIRVAKEDTKTNLADLMTKTMSRPERERLMDKFMY